MDNRDRILAEIDAAFSEPPPDWFGPEFQGQALKLVRRWITGEAAGDPFLFMDAAGFKHFVPALARVAYGTGPDFVLDRVLHYLTRERIGACSEAERAAVEALLLDLREALRSELDGEISAKLDCGLRRLRGEPCESDHERERILAEIAEAFAVPRPDWFVNAQHCCECAEHEAELQAETVETLRREVMGDGAWDPVTFISNPDGYKYFMPALARIACATGPEYFLGSFLTYLHADRVESFTARQRAAVEALLLHLAEVLGPEIDAGMDRETYNWALGASAASPVIAGGTSSPRRAAPSPNPASAGS
jgi:hypothetical protein